MGMDPDTPTGGPFLGSALAPKIAFLEHSHSNATINPNTVKKSYTRGQQTKCVETDNCRNFLNNCPELVYLNGVNDMNSHP